MPSSNLRFANLPAQIFGSEVPRKISVGKSGAAAADA